MRGRKKIKIIVGALIDNNLIEQSKQREAMKVVEEALRYIERWKYVKPEDVWTDIPVKHLDLQKYHMVIMTLLQMIILAAVLLILQRI